MSDTQTKPKILGAQPAPSVFSVDDVTFIRHPKQALSDNKLADLFLCDPNSVRNARTGASHAGHHMPPRGASPRVANTRRH